jgi:hypothetical protein
MYIHLRLENEAGHLFQWFDVEAEVWTIPAAGQIVLADGRSYKVVDSRVVGSTVTLTVELI